MTVLHKTSLSCSVREPVKLYLTLQMGLCGFAHLFEGKTMPLNEWPSHNDKNFLVIMGWMCPIVTTITTMVLNEQLKSDQQSVLGDLCCLTCPCC